MLSVILIAIMLSIIMHSIFRVSVIILSVVMFSNQHHYKHVNAECYAHYHYAACRCVEFHYAQHLYAPYHYAEYRWDKCRYTECHGVLGDLEWPLFHERLRWLRKKTLRTICTRAQCYKTIPW